MNNGRPLNLTIEHLLSLEEAVHSVDPHSLPPSRQPRPTSPSSLTNLPKGLNDQRSTRESFGSRQIKFIKPLNRSGRNFIKGIFRSISRISITALVVMISIVLPDFDRVMSFLGVEFR